MSDPTKPHSSISNSGTFENKDTLPEFAVKRPSLANKIFKTFAIDAAYFGAALSLGIIGPSLIDLESMTHTTGSEIATIFTVRGILAILGSLVLNPVLERFNRYLSVGISLFFTGLLTLLAPFSRSLEAILLTLGPPEFFGCALGMGTHLLCVEIWRGGAGPFLQLLNFVSITGFAVAPLIVSPFLSHTNTIKSPIFDAEIVGKMLANGTVVKSIHQNVSMLNTHNALNSSIDFVNPKEVSQVYVAYIIVGIYCLVTSMGFAMIIYFDKYSQTFMRKTNIEDDQSGENRHTYSNIYIIFIYIQFYLLILFYGGIEVGYCGLVPTFAVRQLGWSKEIGALVVTVVQGFNAAFTALGIFLSHILKPTTIILVDIIIVVISLCILDLLVEAYPNLLWGCSALLGIGSASIMPSAYTWANDMFEITGTFNGFYWCGFFSGFMIMPAVAGAFMHLFDKMWFCHVFLICSLIDLFIFLTLMYSVKKGRGSKTRKDDINVS